MPKDRSQRGWMNWRRTLVLVGVIFALRMVYLVWLCPMELVGDEAQYWDWSRRAEWSYYTKGPGVAWAIRAATAVFGHTEWAVRLPAAVASALTALALARLTIRLTAGDERAGFIAAALFCAAPGYLVTAQLMTIDAPYIACWVLAAWAARHALDGEQPTSPILPQGGGSRTWAWIAFGAAVGVGVLFKYTMLFILPGVVLYAVLSRKRLGVGAILAPVVAAVIVSPIIVWNMRHDWATVAHQLGRVRLPGGDEPVDWQWKLKWPAEYLAAQVGLLSPMGVALMVLSLRRGVPLRGRGLMICCAAPVVLFFIALCLLKRTQGNWALAGYTTLLPLAAQLIVSADLPPKLRRMVTGLWRWHVGVGAGTAVVVGVGAWVVLLPGVIDQSSPPKPFDQFVGRRALAAKVDAVVADLRRATGAEPIIITTNYRTTGRLAYYMRGQPIVYCAQAWLGYRRCAYDYFADTDLTAPSLRGRPAVLVGGREPLWRRTFRFDDVRTLNDAASIHVGLGYAGPVTDTPTPPPTIAPAPP